MDVKELTEKILAGTNLAVIRMIKRKQQSGGYIVIMREGKVVKVPAKDIEL